MGLSAPMSEAQHFPGFSGGKKLLKPKKHNIKLIYNELFKQFSKLSKSTWKIQVQCLHSQKPKKLLHNRQMPIKHNYSSTCGDISTLKGG